VAERRQRRFVGSLAAAFVLLLAIAGYGVVQSQHALAARDFVRHSRAVQDAIADAQSHSALMEANQLGYLVSGHTDAIGRRDREYLASRDALRRLQSLAQGDVLQSRRVRDALAALDARHTRMRMVVDVATTRGLDAARAAYPSEGAGSIDPVFAGLSALRQREALQLEQRTAHADREAGLFRLVVLLGSTLALLVVAATATLMLRQLRRNAALGRQLLQMHVREEERSQELERSNRELEAFTYTISHDLRAPLRHIDGYVRMLQEDVGEQLDGDASRYLETISDSARRMGALIDDLLAYSRMGRKPVECARLDMNALTERVLDEAGADRSEATVAVTTLPEAWADPVLLRQAWVNLLSNALKYSAPKGNAARIEISGERDDKTVRYRIRDNGVGFDMRYADKLFGVFQRMHAQDEFEGTGVGLAIVQQVVQRHGGRVTAQAAPGEGACFTVELPAGGT
jgi:signal transduction histidine kinase